MYHGKISLDDRQLDYLVRHFKDTDNGYLALRLGISESSLHRLARRFGLKKTKAHCRQMQKEATEAAKRSHMKNGTYPPKGFRIPNSEKYWFKPGHKEKAATKRLRIEEAARTRRDTIRNERMRLLRGEPQQTMRKLTRQPDRKVKDRHYLKTRGYVIDDAASTAYYTEDTRRAVRLEKSPRYYRFLPAAEQKAPGA